MQQFVALSLRFSIYKIQSLPLSPGSPGQQFGKKQNSLLSMDIRTSFPSTWGQEVEGQVSTERRDAWLARSHYLEKRDPSAPKGSVCTSHTGRLVLMARVLSLCCSAPVLPPCLLCAPFVCLLPCSWGAQVVSLCLIHFPLPSAHLQTSKGWYILHLTL